AGRALRRRPARPGRPPRRLGLAGGPGRRMALRRYRRAGLLASGVIEMDGSGGHETLTILFTDVEGSTAFRTRAGDAAGNRVMSDHDRLVLEQVARHEGRHVKSLGDGCMA